MKTMKIFGPPGTGKTTTLISILEKLLARGYPPSQIAYLSHTKAAAEEVRDRISQRFDSLNLQKDFIWFRTIHSACCRKLGISRNEIFGAYDLRKFSEKKGWPCRGITDIESLLQEDIGGVNYDSVLGARSHASHKMIPVSEAMANMPNNPAFANAEEFLKDYKAYKQELGKIDFVDMVEMVRGKGGLGVSVMLVDESQDLSKRQFSVIEEWAEDLDFLYLAGDDDQAIYAFMGASEYGFLDYPCDETRILKQSFRCPPQIGERAERIISKVSKREEKDVEWNADKIGAITRSGDFQSLPWRKWASGDESVMVLARHRKLCLNAANDIRDMNIPVSLMGESSTIGPTADAIRVWLGMRVGESFSGARIATMFQKIKYTEEAKNARHLASKDNEGEWGREEFPGVDWENDQWPALFSRDRFSRRRIEDLRKIVNRYGLEVLGAPLKIDISTYHASKGREADIVVLLTDCYRVAWEEQQTNPDTEIRLCYVGLTRAKRRAIICSPRTDMYLKALMEN